MYQFGQTEQAAAEGYLLRGIQFVSRPRVATALRELSWYQGVKPDRAQKTLNEIRQTLAVVRDKSEVSIFSWFDCDN